VTNVTNANDTFLAVFHSAERRGDTSVAVGLASKAIEHYLALGDEKYRGIWYGKLALALYWRGEYEQCLEAARSSVLIQTDLKARGRSLTFLAAIHCALLDTESAATTTSDAEEISVMFPHDTHLRGTITNTRGFLNELRGDLDSAIVDWETSAKTFRDYSEPFKAAAPLNNMGCLLAENKQFDPAEIYLLSALKCLQRPRYIHSEGGVYSSLGLLYTSCGRYSEAETCLERSIERFTRAMDRYHLAEAKMVYSELSERKRNLKLARNHAEGALALATEANSRQLILKAQTRLASIESLVPTYLPSPQNFHGLLYASESMHSAVAKLKAVARTTETVLVLGNTGTGKELVAQALHAESPRRNGPFIAFNCTSLSRDMIESRLFGHRKGAFTGADRDHIGIIRAAEGGTLLLDEIGDLSLEAQGALLRFLQSREIQPVGETRPIKVDTRVVAATNRDLAKEVDAGRFRADLFHRLNVVALYLPPLWQRRDEIGVLARHFARAVSQQHDLPEPILDADEIARLADYDWPGNVRELENYIRRRVILGDTELPAQQLAARAATAQAATQTWTLTPPAPIASAVSSFSSAVASHDGPSWQPRDWQFSRGDWPDDPMYDGLTGSFEGRSWRSLPESERRQRLWEALEQTSGNITRAAELLGISRRAIQKRRRKTKVHEV
jgi:transcriptional regulator with GAF, ATPase, and Fis domain